MERGKSPSKDNDRSLDKTRFEREYEKQCVLGQGSDGIVVKYVHKTMPGQDIAVKYCRNYASGNTKAELKREVTNLVSFRHENIISLRGWCEHESLGTMLFLEYCHLGDVRNYRTKLLEVYSQPPEVTVWKFMADMSRAINYLHNELSLPRIHQDIKPENILVSKQIESDEDFPILPVFKVADFARAYDYTKQIPGATWAGTYKPPRRELTEGVTPKSDILCLGASIQYLALGCRPVKSSRSIKLKREFEDGKNNVVQTTGDRAKYSEGEYVARSPVFRPLNVTASEMVMKWDWPNPEAEPPQYSDELNFWYATYLEFETRKRISAADLMKHFVPIAERRIATLQAVSTFVEADNKLQQLEKRHAENKSPLGITPPEKTHLNGGQGSTLHRKDYDLPPRPKGRMNVQDSDELRSLNRKEQAYLRGMRPKQKP